MENEIKKTEVGYQERLEREMVEMTRPEKIAFLKGVSFGNKDGYETHLKIMEEMRSESV